MSQINTDIESGSTDGSGDNEPEPEPEGLPTSSQNDTTANLIVDIQIACESCFSLPADAHLQQWVNACIDSPKEDTELTIRIVDAPESRSLNHSYRGKDKPTNVLSFPANHPKELHIAFLGDIVICADIVTQEAKAQNKTEEAHWAHMVVHGTLHLLGYDHIENDEAEAMETLETHILRRLGYPAPYAQIKEQLSRKDIDV